MPSLGRRRHQFLTPVIDTSKHLIRVEIERWMIETGLVRGLRVGAQVNYALECRLHPLQRDPVEAPTPPGLVHEGPVTAVGEVGPLKLVEVESLVVPLNQLDGHTHESGQLRRYWLTFSPYQTRLRTMLATHEAVTCHWGVAALWEFDTDVPGGATRRRRDLPDVETLRTRPASLYAVDLYPSE